MGELAWRRVLILSILCLWGLWLWLVGATKAPTHHPFTLRVTPTQTIAGRLYLPPNATRPVPAVLLCHGVNSSKDTLTPLAQALARRGIAAVVFDFGGYGQSYRRRNDPVANRQDATAVLQWMQRQPQLNGQKLGIGGHSMGGTTALELARSHPELKTTIVLSIAGPASPTSPANLWMGSGVYEELNPVADMQDLFASTVAGEVAPFITVGDFAQGTARRLVFSATVDHALAPYDANLHREIIAWIEQSLDLPPSHQPLQNQRQLLGQVLTVGSAIGLGIALYSIRLREWGGWIRVVLSLGSVILLLVPAAGGTGWAIPSLITVLVGNYCHGPSPTSQSPLRRLFLFGGLLYGLGLVAIAANALLTGALLAMPGAVLGFPRLAKTIVVGLLYDRFHMVRYGLDSPVGLGGVMGLMAIEAVKPGWVFSHLGILANRLIHAMRQPIQWQWQTASNRPLLLLSLLLFVLIGILFQQQQSGLLTWEAGEFALRLVGVFLVLPGMIGVGVIRSRCFQHLEDRLR